MMDSAQEVLQSMGVPVDFEELYFSEVLKKSDLLNNRQYLLFCNWFNSS